MSISIDGRFLLFDTVGTETGGDVWFVPLDAPASAAAFVSTPYFERRAGAATAVSSSSTSTGR